MSRRHWANGWTAFSTELYRGELVTNSPSCSYPVIFDSSLRNIHCVCRHTQIWIKHKMYLGESLSADSLQVGLVLSLSIIHSLRHPEDSVDHWLCILGNVTVHSWKGQHLSQNQPSSAYCQLDCKRDCNSIVVTATLTDLRGSKWPKLKSR